MHVCMYTCMYAYVCMLQIDWYLVDGQANVNARPMKSGTHSHGVVFVQFLHQSWQEFDDAAARVAIIVRMAVDRHALVIGTPRAGATSRHSITLSDVNKPDPSQERRAPYHCQVRTATFMAADAGRRLLL